MAVKLTLTRHLIGNINLSGGKVDITDPGYDKDVWCRINQENVFPATYKCYAYTGNDTCFGERTWITQIVCTDTAMEAIAEGRIASGRSWRRIGEIGVDSGLAGFFPDKPDFDDDRWRFLCDWMFDKSNKHEWNDKGIDDVFITKYGFFTESGCGDGVYDVYAIREKGKIIALEIRF